MHLPAEWSQQAFVQIAWPHADTDWKPYLPAAEACYCRIAREIARRETLFIVTPHNEEVCELMELMKGIKLEHIIVARIEINDTWARDHAFLTCVGVDGVNTNKTLMDFGFNGWGLKFAANLDNQINSHTFLAIRQLLGGKAEYRDVQQTILEGGSIESDGEGTILTTTSCLLAPNRNGFRTKAEAEAMLRDKLHAVRVLWLDHSWLEGDDTDGHIDTVARFCPNDTIAYVQCTDPGDVHYEGLHAMEQELHAMRTRTGKPYRLIPLPLPDPIYEGNFDDAVSGEEYQRLPATYANFLIINGAVLMPTYDQPRKDALAKKQLQEAFPDREIVGIDCRVLIRQHGSLHCITMQYPL